MNSEPEIVRVIAEKIKSWLPAGKEIMTKPIASPMRLMYISHDPQRGAEFRGYVCLSDFTDLWAKALELSLTVKGFNLSKIFVELMGLEVTLQWNGFRRNATFVPHPILRKLKETITSLSIKSRLADVLNHNAELSNKIKTVKPSKIDVKITGTIPDLHRDDNLQVFLKYIQDPDGVFWEIILSASLSRVLRRTIDKHKAEGAIDIMSLIAKNIIEVSGYQIAC